MSYIEIDTEQQWEKEVTNYDGFVIVDFWAPWCGPCKMFGPTFEKVSKTREDIKFLKVNVDENEMIASKLNIMGIPAIFIFKNGEKIIDKSGVLNSEDLNSFIDENIK